MAVVMGRFTREFYLAQSSRMYFTRELPGLPEIRDPVYLFLPQILPYPPDLRTAMKLGNFPTHYPILILHFTRVLLGAVLKKMKILGIGGPGPGAGAETENSRAPKNSCPAPVLEREGRRPYL